MRNPGGKTPSWLTYSTCSIGHHSSGLCSANKSPLLPLSHAIMTTKLPRHCGQRKEEWTSPHRLVFAWVHSVSHLFKLPSGKLFSRCLATVQITTFIPESHLSFVCTCNPYTYSATCFCGLLCWMELKEEYSSPHYTIYLKDSRCSGWLIKWWPISSANVLLSHEKGCV